MNQNLFDRLVSLHFKFYFGFKLVWDWEYIPAKRMKNDVVQGQFISWFFFLLWKWMSCERIWHPRGQINRSFFERFWNLLYFLKWFSFVIQIILACNKFKYLSQVKVGGGYTYGQTFLWKTLLSDVASWSHHSRSW